MTYALVIVVAAPSKLNPTAVLGATGESSGVWRNPGTIRGQKNARVDSSCREKQLRNIYMCACTYIYIYNNYTYSWYMHAYMSEIVLAYI